MTLYSDIFTWDCERVTQFQFAMLSFSTIDAKNLATSQLFKFTHMCAQNTKKSWIKWMQMYQVHEAYSTDISSFVILFQT